MKVDSVITVKEQELTKGQWRELLKKLTFYDADGQEIIAYDHRVGDCVIMGRGVWEFLPEDIATIDLRCKPAAPKLAYTKVLDDEDRHGQIAALEAMIRYHQGQVIAPPGNGKTEIALAFCASAKTPSLVVVHTKDLFTQWMDRAKVSVPGASLGEIRGSVCQVGHITIAMAQTLKRYVGAGRKFWGQWGCVIVDEAHHGAAETWEWILNSSPAYYRFGMTATDKRADGRHPLVKFNIGPVIYRMKFESQVPIEIQPVRTGFGLHEVVYRGPFDWHRLLRTLSADPERNRMIAELASKEIEAGHSVLILSRQIKHLEAIHEALTETLTPSASIGLVTGRMGLDWRHKAIQELRDGKLGCILATQLADEGLDVPRLDRVFLTFPGKAEGRIVQQVGRAIRKAPDKEDALIYDFVDDLVPPLLRQYGERRDAYKSMKIIIRKAVGYGTEKKKRRIVPSKFRVARAGRD